MHPLILQAKLHYHRKEPITRGCVSLILAWPAARRRGTWRGTEDEKLDRWDACAG